MRHVSKWVACLVLCFSAAGWAFQPAQQEHAGEQAFFKPELYLPITNMPLEKARAKMTGAGPSAGRLLRPQRRRLPRVPGPADGACPPPSRAPSRSSPARAWATRSASAACGSSWAAPWAGWTRRWWATCLQVHRDNQAAIGVDLLQLGEPRVTQVTESLWQVHIPQQVNGVPVRHGRLAATINHGNLILLGTEAWCNVPRPPGPRSTRSRRSTAGGERFWALDRPASCGSSPRWRSPPWPRPMRRASARAMATSWCGPTASRARGRTSAGR